MKFYGSRIPSYYRDKMLLQSVLAIATMAGTLLAFLKLGLWTAIASSLAAAIVSVSTLVLLPPVFCFLAVFFDRVL